MDIGTIITVVGSALGVLLGGHVRGNAAAVLEAAKGVAEQFVEREVLQLEAELLADPAVATAQVEARVWQGLARMNIPHSRVLELAVHELTVRALNHVATSILPSQLTAMAAQGKRVLDAFHAPPIVPPMAP